MIFKNSKMCKFKQPFICTSYICFVYAWVSWNTWIDRLVLSVKMHKICTCILIGPVTNQGFERHTATHGRTSWDLYFLSKGCFGNKNIMVVKVTGCEPGISTQHFQNHVFMCGADALEMKSSMTDYHIWSYID